MDLYQFLTQQFWAARPDLSFGKYRRGIDQVVFRNRMAMINPRSFCEAPKIPTHVRRNPKGREAARQVHCENVRAQQAQGMEYASVRKKLRLKKKAKNGR